MKNVLPGRVGFLCMGFTMGLACTASAGEGQPLAEVEVRAVSDDLLGVAQAASEGVVTGAQLARSPLLRPAEVLEAVPGLIVSQHSGDGKANQYYLRGFNLDHGTDFATWLMGMPVNMPSHAHGQGYTDLNFLIPELVGRVDYRKGAYRAEDGDFSSAGSARIDYLRSLDQPFVKTELGSHGYRRAVLAGSRPLQEGGPTLLGALELMGNQGPWQVGEDLHKYNGVLRLSDGSALRGWSVAAMAYQADWSATDQIPRRAVASGALNPYGSLNPSDGGRTRRISLSGEWVDTSDTGQRRASLYWVDYRLDLFSDFTYFMDNPVQGDQFAQSDRRQVLGGQYQHSGYADWQGRPLEWVLGTQFRYDHIGRLALGLSEQRQVYRWISQHQVEQMSGALFGEARVQWSPWLRSTLGLRADQYLFDVQSDTAANSGQRQQGLISPKLGVVLGPWAGSELYLAYGEGFHSNDARGATLRVNADPRSEDYGQPATAVRPLVRTRASELGWRWQPGAGVSSTLALWRLDLDSELVFAGDAGTTEASRPSRRQGLEWSVNWKLRPALALGADLAWSHARFREDDGSGTRVPGAIGQTAAVRLDWDQGGPWSAGVRWRYFGSRPLIEDDSVRSAASVLTALRLGWRSRPDLEWGLDVFNLFNRRVSDIDYYYASRLGSETMPVADVHSHPAEPRSWRLSLKVRL
ncbi:TonB-dependent receptor [Zoogloea sp.]|uniref:TonB-dependent receptor n=1 Tax=Zoogloea sp. TaxID=49181 RepID=UPI0035B00B4D